MEMKKTSIETQEHSTPVPDASMPPVPRTRLDVARRAARSPLLILWLLTAVCLAGGILEWLFLDGLPWEGLGSATLIASVTEIVARVRRIPAWPWRRDPGE